MTEQEHSDSSRYMTVGYGYATAGGDGLTNTEIGDDIEDDDEFKILALAASIKLLCFWNIILTAAIIWMVLR